jgi:hypothetical protein
MCTHVHAQSKSYKHTHMCTHTLTHTTAQSHTSDSKWGAKLASRGEGAKQGSNGNIRSSIWRRKDAVAGMMGHVCVCVCLCERECVCMCAGVR